MQWIFTVVEFLGSIRVIRKKEPVEPLLDGYEELKNGFVLLTKDLTRQITLLNKTMAECIRTRKRLAKALGQNISKFKKEIRECNDHRKQLHERVETLEKKADEEYDYTHDNVHDLKDVLLGLESDLEASGIPIETRTAVLLAQKKRHNQTKQIPPAEQK